MTLEDIIELSGILRDASVPNYFIAAGLFFLFLALVGNFGLLGIHLSNMRQSLFVILGLVVLVSGALLYIIPTIPPASIEPASAAASNLSPTQTTPALSLQAPSASATASHNAETADQAVLEGTEAPQVSAGALPPSPITDAPVTTISTPSPTLIPPTETSSPSIEPLIPIVSSGDNTSQPGGGGDDRTTANKFMVIQNDVNIRREPTLHGEVIANVDARAPVTVDLARLPVYSESERVTWWPIFAFHQGDPVAAWIAEVYQGERLIKPSLSIGDEVRVVDMLCLNGETGKGVATLHFSPPQEYVRLRWGTRLRITEGPRSIWRNDGDDNTASREGREWWRVVLLEDSNSTPSGTEGWIRDFHVRHKQLIIAPDWYVLASPLVSQAEGAQECLDTP